MRSSTNIIDLNLYRKRKQAQRLGRLMWAMYAQQAGFAAQQWVEAARQAQAHRQA